MAQALDTINRIKKDKAQVVKEARLKLEHLATHKGSAHRLRLDVDKGTRRQQGLTAQIEDLEAKLRAQTEVPTHNCSKKWQGINPDWLNKILEVTAAMLCHSLLSLPQARLLPSMSHTQFETPRSSFSGRHLLLEMNE